MFLLFEVWRVLHGEVDVEVFLLLSRDAEVQNLLVHLELKHLTVLAPGRDSDAAKVRYVP